MFWRERSAINRAEVWELIFDMEAGEVGVELVMPSNVLGEENICLFW
jgi:hypothetical protein